jgi:predicted ABC-type ATPase
MIPDNSPNSLRMHIFAGPNGSGKSTLIKQLISSSPSNPHISTCHYINADDIALQLKSRPFEFGQFNLHVKPGDFVDVVVRSGLINERFSYEQFTQAFTLSHNKLHLAQAPANEMIAQILADFLRKSLIREKRSIIFETVFSHASKLEIMKQAKDQGYGICLYYIATESVAINRFRVQVRVRKGGHDVPAIKIEERYYRSLELMYDAASLCNEVFFIDNSGAATEVAPFVAHFHLAEGKKAWDLPDNDNLPLWFRKYYLQKDRGSARQ